MAGPRIGKRGKWLPTAVTRLPGSPPALPPSISFGRMIGRGKWLPTAITWLPGPPPALPPLISFGRMIGCGKWLPRPWAGRYPPYRALSPIRSLYNCPYIVNIQHSQAPALGPGTGKIVENPEKIPPDSVQKPLSIPLNATQNCAELSPEYAFFYSGCWAG